GEIAVRVIRACRQLGLETVAVYSTAEREAAHTRLADRAVCIGPPAAAGSYLNIPALVTTAVGTGCDAVHPGYGFLAENASFAEKCEAHGLCFVGPPSAAIQAMGDKVRARELAAKIVEPVVPASDGSVATLAATGGLTLRI